MRDELKAFRALSDETRLRIFRLLLQGESSVCDVVKSLGISQASASRGLRALHDAGFLKLKKEGTWCLYSIDHDGANGYLKDLIRVVGLMVGSFQEPGNAEHQGEGRNDGVILGW